MTHSEPSGETYNSWTIVNVVFSHLAEQGLHPVLGGPGHPGEAAAALLRALGITPTAGDARTAQAARQQLDELREKILGQA